MSKKITLLDGAGGTTLWAIAERNGVAKDPVWIYNIEHPEYVEELVKSYADAGSEMIYTNTFGANRLAVEKSSSYSAPEVVKAGVEISKRVLAGTGIKSALSIGPLSVLLEPFGDLEEDECEEIYEEMIKAGVEAGADAIVLETFLDLNMLSIAASVAVKYGVPVYCSMTFEKVGKTMFGNSVEDMVEELEPLGVAGVGMNCSLGPELAIPIIEEFAKQTTLPILFKPNAGLPVDGGESECTAESFAKAVEPALSYVSLVGGCCGSNPDYIREIKKLLE